MLALLLVHVHFSEDVVQGGGTTQEIGRREGRALDEFGGSEGVWHSWWAGHGGMWLWLYNWLCGCVSDYVE